MKKLKLISSLTSISALVAATPVVATSCSNKEEASSELKLKLSNKPTKVVAGSPTGNALLYSFLTKDDSIQHVKNVVATSSEPEKISVDLPIGSDDVTLISINGQNAAKDDKATITIKATDLNDKVYEEKFEVTASDAEYEAFIPTSINDVPYGDTMPWTQIPVYITNAGNWSCDLNPSNGDFAVQILNDNDENVTANFYAGVSSAPGVGDWFEPYYILVRPKVANKPALGEYQFHLTITPTGASEAILDETLRFNLVNGFNKGPSAGSSTYWTWNTSSLDDYTIPPTLYVQKNSRWYYSGPEYFQFLIDTNCPDVPAEGIEYSLDKKIPNTEFDTQTGILLFKEEILSMKEELTITAKCGGKVLATMKFILHIRNTPF